MTVCVASLKFRLQEIISFPVINSDWVFVCELMLSSNGGPRWRVSETMIRSFCFRVATGHWRRRRGDPASRRDALVTRERAERPAREALLVGRVLHLLFDRVDGHRAYAHERVPKVAARLRDII